MGISVRIVLVNDYGMLVGGAEQYLFMLRDALRAAKNEVLVVSSDSQRSHYPFESEKQLPASGSCFNLDSLFNPRSYAGFRRILREWNPDVVHFHNVFYRLSPAVIWAAKRYPSVLTLHDYFAICLADKTQSRGVACSKPLSDCSDCRTCVANPRFELLRRLVSRAALKSVGTLIAPSEFVATEFRKNGLTRVQVVEHPAMKASTVAEDGTSAATPRTRLLFVGRLVEQKGVDVAINALEILRQKQKQFQLTIVGDGMRRAELESQVHHLGLSDSVRFVGWCEPRERDEEYRRADIVLQPALWPEVSGLTVLEAARFGVVPIVSRIGALGETVRDGENGLVVTPGVPADWAEAIISLSENNALYRRLQVRLVETLSERTIEQHSQRLLALYRAGRES
jgi:glycosyltransferase involved in cell wall biosynthesis